MLKGEKGLNPEWDSIPASGMKIIEQFTERMASIEW